MNYSDPSGHDRFSASNNGFAETMGQCSNQYPENPSDAAQASAAYDQRLQNTRDAIAAQEANAKSGSTAYAGDGKLDPGERPEDEPTAAAPQNPAPGGTLTIRDNIQQHRAVDIDPQCGSSNGGGCTTRVSALTVSFSTNDGTNWKIGRAHV